MSSECTITTHITGLTEDEFDRFIHTPIFDDGENFAGYFGGCDFYYHADTGTVISDSGMRWRPMEFKGVLEQHTKRFPDALLHFRVHYFDGDGNPASEYYVKNGMLFVPKIHVTIEKFDESKLRPLNTFTVF